MGRQSKLKRYRSSRELFCPRELVRWVFDHCRFRTRERAGRIADHHEARGRLKKFE
jgi:hypothetical protein